MLRTGILPALLVLVFSLSLSISADARRLRYYQGYERTDRSDGDSARRARATKLPEICGVGALSVVVDRMISGCGAEQAGELGELSVRAIARIAAPDEVQKRRARSVARNRHAGTERLASDCPQSVPAEPAVRLEAVERAIDATSAAFASVVPALQKFYSALDDERRYASSRHDARPLAAPFLQVSERRSDRASDWIGAPLVGVPMQALTAPPLRKVGTASASNSSRRSGTGRSERSRAA